MTLNWQGSQFLSALLRGVAKLVALHSTPQKNIRHNSHGQKMCLIFLFAFDLFSPTSHHSHFLHSSVSIIPVHDPGNDLHPALAISRIPLGQIAQITFGPHSNLCYALVLLTSRRPCHLHHLARRPFVIHLDLNPKKKHAPEAHCPRTGRGPHPAQGLVSRRWS